MIKVNLKGMSRSKSLNDIIGKLIYLIPALWIAVIGVSFLDTITYSGFFLKHTFINPLALYVLFGLIELLGSFILKREKYGFIKYFQKINFLLSIILFLLFISFSFIESVTYTNFVFSTFHINLWGLATLVGLTIYTDFVLFDLKYLVLPIFGVILMLVLENNLSTLWIKNRDSILYVFNHPKDTYKQRMENGLGKQFYDYVLFVKENTPENSKILLPPFPAYPWPQTGNGTYMRYFLYPRTLLNGQEYAAGYDLKKEGIVYVLLAWGETEATSNGYTHGWPKFDVKADRIIYWNTDGTIKTKPGSYIYNDVKGQQLWGLIKVTK